MKCPKCGCDVSKNKKCSICGLYIFDEEDLLSPDEIETYEIAEPYIKAQSTVSTQTTVTAKTDLKQPRTPAAYSVTQTLEPPKDAAEVNLHSNMPQEGENAAPVKSGTAIKVVTLIFFCILCGLVGNLYMNGVFARFVIPKGEISSPAATSVTGTKVEVAGLTEHVIRGNYIWLAVDKEEYRQCWPKTLVSTPNDMFSETIYEGGPPEEAYTLSLYAVNKSTNDRWLDWLDKKDYYGLPMPSNKRRLDSVLLVKEKGIPKTKAPDNTQTK